MRLVRHILLIAATCLSIPGQSSAATASQPATQSASDATPSIQALLDSAADLIREGRSRAAMGTLDQAEKLEPQNPWLWFYRGLAEYNQGNVYRAMESFDRATDLLAEFGNPDPKLTEAIGRYRREARRQVLRLDYQAGLAYDTNVSFLGSTGSTLGITSGKPDGKYGQTFDVHYSPLVKRDEVLTIGGRLGHVWNFSIDEFNYQDYGSSIRYARMLAEQWEVSLQYDYDMSLLGNDSFLSNHALTPGLTYHWRPTTDRSGWTRPASFISSTPRTSSIPPNPPTTATDSSTPSASSRASSTAPCRGRYGPVTSPWGTGSTAWPPREPSTTATITTSTSA